MVIIRPYFVSTGEDGGRTAWRLPHNICAALVELEKTAQEKKMFGVEGERESNKNNKANW